MDEAITVYVAKLSLSQLVQTASALDLNPPLYALFLHYWLILFGDSEFVLRLLSVVFGVLAIPVIFFLGRLLFDEEAGLAAALILSISSFNVQYSQEVRMYSLMLLLTLLSMYLFFRFLRKNNFLVSIGYVFCTTLLLYSHVFGLFVVVAQNIFLLSLLLLRRGKPLPVRRWMVSQVVILALFAPWVQVLVDHTSIVQREFWVPLPTLNTLSQTFTSYGGNKELLLVFIALSLYSFFTYTNLRSSTDWKRGLKAARDYLRGVQVTCTESVMFLAVWLLTVTAVPFIISVFSTSIFYDRYTIGASAALFLLAAGGLSNINRRYVRAVIIVLIVLLSSASLFQYYTLNTKPNAQEPFNVINNNFQSGDVVIAFPGYTKFIFDYYGQEINANVIPFPVADYYSMSWGNKNTSENIQELQSDVNGHDHIWFVSATGHGSAELLIQAKTTLDESYNVQSSLSYQGYEVILYEKHV